MRTITRFLAGLVVLLALCAAVVVWLNLRGEEPVGADTAPLAASPDVIERGAYLARAGNCIGCHTAPGGSLLAGGRGIETPFGTVMAPNLTPDRKTGLGDWSSSEFWRAMRHGRSKDGRLLYPAFPYPSFTQVTRADSDALFAWLRTVPAVEQANAPHALRFPYNTQAALAVWRALFFRPSDFTPDPTQDAEWNRGRYLVEALGHCAACHSSRNLLGATNINTEYAGGLMPDATWYAPSLASPAEAGVQQWPVQEVVRLLRDGVSAQATVSGPMAEVIHTSTRYLRDDDLSAMARFLASIPIRPSAPAAAPAPKALDLSQGEKVYAEHCASCHGERGEGAPGRYPALAGNRAVTMPEFGNVVQMIRHGGFPPATPGNPRPYGMPPYDHLLSSEEIAAVTTYIRRSWGNNGSVVHSLDVLRIR